MFTIEFAKATGERAVKTFAQALVVLLGAGAVDIIHVPWQTDLSLSAGAALVSVLTSIASGAVSKEPGPSLTNVEVLATHSVSEGPV